MLFLPLAALVAHAQTIQPNHPAFDVTSVKIHKDGPLARPGFSNGRFRFSGPVQLLISMAYQLPFNRSPRLSGGPDWIRDRREMYDIDAKGSVPGGLATSAREERETLML
ncbi:MAG TPA: hypothetical protein VHC72_06395, partial [Bryobacteraceae bacterium]|nr:hypothetical protein [Bryobacteraceae bacterium]